jgi:hypothetical protein
MRQIRVPMPTTASELSCEGPVSPPAPNAKDARTRLDLALTALPRLDSGLGEDGWTVAWTSAVSVHASLLRLWLWVARSERGADLGAALKAHVESSGFIVRRAPRPGPAHPDLQPRVVYLRDGTVRLGLEPRTATLFDALDVVEEPRDDIDLGLQHRFSAQRCPKCRVVDVPLQLVAGFPDQELMLAAELGEVAFAGCEVDARARRNAQCRRCGADFVAR